MPACVRLGRVLCFRIGWECRSHKRRQLTITEVIGCQCLFFRSLIPSKPWWSQKEGNQRHDFVNPSQQSSHPCMHRLAVCRMAPPLVDAAVACNDTSACESALRCSGSECLDGYCTNPFSKGCLRSILGEDYKLRTCNSQDGTCVPVSHFEVSNELNAC